MSIIKSFFPCLALFLLLSFPLAAVAGMEASQPDSLSMELKEPYNQPAVEAGRNVLPEIRQIPPQSLEELRSEEEMDYYLGSPDDNLWLMFRNWLVLQLVRIFGTEGALSTLEIIVYTLCLIAIVYMVLRLLNVDLSGLLMSSSRKAVLKAENIEAGENIHEIDFQAALAETVRNGAYHKAVRLLYLSALKELSVREHIRWQPGKTNYQYQQELQQSQLQSPFRQLGGLFEWAWYGNFPVSEREYQEAEQFYRSLENKLNQPG